VHRRLAIPRRARRYAGLAAVLGALLAAPAFASVESELAFHRGVVAYGEERFDEARTHFEKVLALDPNDTVALHYLALIAQKQGDRERARQLIERGLTLAADDPDLLMDLGVLQLEAGNLAEARASFDRVLAVRPDDARAHLFAGIAAYRAAAYSESLPHLERAVALDPALALQARYYTGLSEAFLGDLQSAEGAFADVEGLSPQHPLARSADRLRDQIRAPEPERPWQLALSAGGEYDSNPRIAGDTVPRDDDFRGVWRARGSYRVLDADGFSLTTGAEGYWSIHHEEDAVDLQTYRGYATASQVLGPLTLGLGYDFYYTFLAFDDPYLMLNRVTPSLSLRQRDVGLTQLYYQYQNLEFYPNSTTPALNRDGNEHFVGLTQYLFLPAPVSYLRFGALGNFMNTRGTEYQFDGYELFAGGSLALPFAVQLDTLYRFARTYYAYPSTFPPNSKRRERFHRVSIELTKAVTEHVDLSIAGSLGFRHSNIPVFDYNRYVGGAYVTYRF
jgi:tetratricopeptide (TPR) repeat protein